MRKQRVQETELFAQIHTALKSWGWASGSHLPDSTAHTFSHTQELYTPCLSASSSIGTSSANNAAQQV